MLLAWNFTCTSNNTINIYPIFPVFQLHFGQLAVLPFVQAKVRHISGLRCLQLTDCYIDGNTLYWATTSLSCSCITDHFVTQFDFIAATAIACRLLLPTSLEMTFPNLRMLDCLKSQGLCAVTNQCYNLQGLNICCMRIKFILSAVNPQTLFNFSDQGCFQPYGCRATTCMVCFSDMYCTTNSVFM